MAGQPIAIGELRWQVTLAMRPLRPTFGQAGITETIVEIATVHAAIQPLGLQAFIGSEQTETPITHMVYIRWQPFQSLDMFNVILRDIILPDGSQRQETYRIRRAGDIGHNRPDARFAPNRHSRSGLRHRFSKADVSRRSVLELCKAP